MSSTRVKDGVIVILLCMSVVSWSGRIRSDDLSDRIEDLERQLEESMRFKQYWEIDRKKLDEIQFKMETYHAED